LLTTHFIIQKEEEKMKKMMNWMVKEESGQGMVEYGLIIVLVAIAAIVGLTGIGTQLQAKFTEIVGDLA
jgi:pilus assembly protein Flp/PilA